ncbi:wall-associated receptor kinase-like 14 [Rutidosis leptorrhynchoides]|uniref:wall-associated receptor kinase-like 14 n=1 Tax=Rutidosis leptorrhynchoides TaxID=125765 RepID=UPI003A990D63
MIKLHILILILISISIFPSIISQKPYCNKTCPNSILNNLPYPFGFSSGCEIQLNCSQNGIVSIGEFAVEKANDKDGLLVSLPSKCGRNVEALHTLYSENYAPTSENAILMENCTDKIRTCMVPEMMFQPQLQVIDCGGKSDVYGNVSCYSGDTNLPFLDYENVMMAGCHFLLSGMVVKMVGDNPALSLDVQVVKLGWWLKGDCECSEDAICTKFVSPVNGGDGYKCQCKDGFSGDGYKASSGCRKGSSGCHLFGRCEGNNIVGVFVGVVTIGGSLIACIGLVCCYARRRTIAASFSKKNRRLCEVKGITIPIYSYKEIEKATNGFSDKQKLGTGAFGTVYKGKIRKGEWVAIKRIKHRYDTDNINQVMNEITLLSTVSHQNLLRLLGCSVEKTDQILIYEFMPNGTLSQHLQREKGNGLPWPVRLTIAAETAQAISHLHSSKPPIYHRDVKSCNILVDYNFKAKVADFGLSRLGMIESSHISTAPQGTPGYLDPQYYEKFHLSDKSDVYSFGVVLTEIITGLKAVDFSRRHSEINLASLAIDRIGKGNLEDIIDPFLKPIKDDSIMNSIHKVAEVAFRCLALDSDMRPPMAEVATELENIRASNFPSWKENIDIVSAQ